MPEALEQKTRVKNKEILLSVLSKLLNKKDHIEKEYEKLVHPYFDILGNLNKLTDIEKASNVINGVIQEIEKGKEKRKILILTDYDCDGLNSAYVITETLRLVYNLGHQLITLINKRQFGNGVNYDALNQVDLNDVCLIITADHGSVNEEVYKDLKTKHKDLKIVVTDHHQIEETTYPHSADAFVNNQREESKFTRNASGCAVAFLVMLKCVYDANKKNKKYYKSDSDLLEDMLYYFGHNLSLTVISDVMDVTDPFNRYVCKTGFNNIEDRLRNMVVLNNIKGGLTYRDLGFKIIPLINSANRTHIEEVGFKALYGDREAINQLMVANADRKMSTDIIIKQAKSTKHIYGVYGVTVVIDTNLAIAGIIASRIGEDFNAPTVCLNITDHSYEGSARAVRPNFNILGVLKEMERENPDMFLKLGGHKEAAGLAIKRDVDVLDRFINLFNLKVKEALKDLEVIDKYIDIDIKDLNLDLINQLKTLEPFGKGLEEPLFRSRIRIKNINIWSSLVNFMIADEGLTQEIKCTHYTNKSTNKQFDKIYVLDNEIDIVYKPLKMYQSRSVTNLIIEKSFPVGNPLY